MQHGMLYSSVSVGMGEMRGDGVVMIGRVEKELVTWS